MRPIEIGHRNRQNDCARETRCGASDGEVRRAHHAQIADIVACLVEDPTCARGLEGAGTGAGSE